MPAVRPRLAPPRRQAVTTPVRARPTFCTFTAAGGTVYTLPVDGKVQRFPFPENPPVSPTTGEAAVKSRPRHNVVSVKDIVNAFAHEVEMRFDAHGGVIDHLADSTLDTRWNSGIWEPPAKNSATIPADNGSEDVAGTNFNPRTTVFFDGSTNSGVFTWLQDDAPTTKAIYWSSGQWNAAGDILAASNSFRDVETHKGNLLYLCDGSNLIFGSTNGSTFSDYLSAGFDPGSNFDAGSRLWDAGNTLYAFAQDGGGIDVYSTTDQAATAWTTVLSNFTGQLRDIANFFDKDGNDQVVVLTEEGLYWLDATNGALERLLHLPAGGRALATFEDSLLIIMDGFQVWAYRADGSVKPVTPDLNASSDGPHVRHGDSHAMVAESIYGPVAGFASLIGSTTVFTILQYLRKAGGVGWHYINRASTSYTDATLRVLHVDPATGDLILVDNETSADADNSTGYVFPDFETDPETLATQDRATSGTATSSRLDFGSPIVSTTVKAIFGHTVGLDANETLAHAYRTNGSTGAFSAIATQAADNERQWLPDNNAPFEGVNLRDVQLQWTLALSAATDVAKIVSLDIGYERAWDIRYVHILDVITDAQVMGSKPPDVILTDIATILNETTKGTLVYGGQTYYALPDTQTRINEVLGDLARERRAGTVRLVFLSEAA